MLTRPLGKPPEELNFKITRAYLFCPTNNKKTKNYIRKKPQLHTKKNI